MSNVINMGGGGMDLVTGTLKSGSHVIYSDGDASHDEIPTADKSAQVLGNSIVYAPFGLTGGATAMSQAGFWLVTDDFTALEASATASTTPKSGVTYTNGISDLTPDILSKFAAAISNNMDITYANDVVYCDLTSYHRKITVGDMISISMDDHIHNFRIVGFNAEQLTNPSAYGSVTYTGKAGMVFDMVDVYSTPYRLHNTNDGTLNWEDMEISTITLPALKQKLPTSWRNAIKAVTHKVPVITNSYASNVDSSEEIFLPSVYDYISANHLKFRNITRYGSFQPAKEGGTDDNSAKYCYWQINYDANSDNFLNKKNGLSDAPYWLRNYHTRNSSSSYISNGYVYIPDMSTIMGGDDNPMHSHYVSFCFCL